MKLNALLELFRDIDFALGLFLLALLSALSQAASTADAVTFKEVCLGVVMSTFVLSMVWLALKSVEMDETLRVVLAGVAGYSARYLLAAWNVIMSAIMKDPACAIRAILRHIRRQ